jgi:putative aminopeptidase FrvX
MQKRERDLLQRLLQTYGPGGQEEAVRDVCRQVLAPLVDETWIDAAGNLVGLLRGSGDRPGVPVLRVVAHLDELAMIVKRIGDAGELAVSPLGVMYPANFGLGPVTVLGDHGEVTGVLAVGSEHTTQETPRVWQTKPDRGDRALDWLHVHVFTGLSRKELEDKGVHAGSRVCIHASKRGLVDVGDYVGSYFLDDRACLVTLLEAVRRLHEAGRKPRGDTYLVLSTNEEMGGVGATHAVAALPGHVTLALDVGPAEGEYQTTVDSGPIIPYADEAVVYDKSIADRLLGLGRELGLDPAAAVFGAYRSDASHAKTGGASGRSALLCLPTMSTHGYEVIRHDAIGRCAELLAEYIADPAR